MFRVFHDLDEALFEGRLAGNVYLAWACAQDLPDNAKALPGGTCGPGDWGHEFGLVREC